MTTMFRKALPALCAFGLAACASTGGGMRAADREAASLARYEAAAGEAVDSFRYFRLDGFTVLGDSELAVWTSPRQAWLLTVDDPCPGLRWALNVGLSARFGRVYTRSDTIMVERDTCRIRTIRPVDVAALRDSEKAARRAPADAGGSGG